MHDYSNYKEEPGENFLAVLTNLVDLYEKAEVEVDRLTEQLEQAKQHLRTISETQIPELVDGVSAKITLPDGRVVNIKEKFRCYPLKENKDRAMKWLDDNGHGKLVKNKFIIEFNKEDDVTEVRKMLVGMPVKEERSVAWQILDSWGKEQLENGEEIPDVFQVARLKQTKIS